MNRLKISTVLLLILLSFVVTGCTTENKPNTKIDYANIQFNHNIEAKELDSIDNRITKANNTFAFKILKETIDNNINVVISPLSITASLAYFQNGVEGSAKEEILKVLGLSGVEDSVINKSYRDIIAHLNNAEGVEIKLGNSIWVNNIKMKDEFKNIGKSFYEADVEEINFSKKNSGELLNDWILRNTAGNLISGSGTGALSSQIKMFHSGTFCFRGRWETPFINKYSEDGKSDPSSITRMRQILNTEYLDGDNFTAVRLPYEDVNYGMYIFVPDSHISVNDLIKAMNNEKWEEWMPKFTRTQVNVTITKFRMGHGIPLNDKLQTIGINSIFDKNAVFSKISDNNKLSFNGFGQKSYLDINEAGTVVDAKSAVTKKETSIETGEPIYFNVNRAFAYAIVDKKSGLIMVIGKIEY